MAKFMCQHCAREAETHMTEPYMCNAPIDRAAWAKLPKHRNEREPRRPHPRFVGLNPDGQEICLGMMYPIEEYERSPHGRHKMRRLT